MTRPAMDGGIDAVGPGVLGVVAMVVGVMVVGVLVTIAEVGGLGFGIRGENPQAAANDRAPTVTTAVQA